MDELLAERIEPKLAGLIQGVGLQRLSRISAARFEENALPNIGTIERVSSETFEREYQPLYLAMFHGGERELPELIVERLKDDFDGYRSGLAPYRVVGVRDRQGTPIGAAQFSVLTLTGTNYAVPYLQYIYVRPENRRQDMSEVLHTMVLAVATGDARSMAPARLVPFTLFETEPPEHGISESSRTNATQRVQIHMKSGSKAVMLVDVSGGLYSCHVQPGLEPGHPPVTLVWVIRPSPGEQLPESFDINDIGMSLLAGFYQSMRDEGFPEKEIAHAERTVYGRCEGRRFVEMPLGEITAAMYQNLEVGAEPTITSHD